ncbi:MAG: DUF4437 domain-containing protein [Steroidobacteraceae bacterium]
MARPQLEFVHAQQLPWQDQLLGRDVLVSHRGKRLSEDAASGAMSALLQFPDATQLASQFALGCDFEALVLEGGLQVAGHSLGLDDYTYLPAGCAWQGAQLLAGTVLLVFSSASARQAQALANLRPAICHTHEMPWTSAEIDPDVQFLQLSHKILRDDPERGEKTLLLATGAQTHPKGWSEAQLRHDCVEEMYLLGGDIIGERGIMREGAYFWRPAGLWHGPFGSRRGSLSLIRMLGGRHRNEWSATKRRFWLSPAYDPVLPPELAHLAGAPWTPHPY